MSETKVMPTDFNNKPLFAVFEVDEDGEKTSEKGYPVVSFGLKKAKAIIEHIEELKEYVEENDK